MATTALLPQTPLADLAWAELSQAEQLARLPAVERSALLAALSEAEHAALEHDWQFWGRPEQRVPEDEAWDVLIWLAGRGGGKTRAGAEWINGLAEIPGQHFALIGETAAEARDVMVEGMSGILATAKPWNPAFYEPSKRRVVWPKTGCWATTFSGDSPEQLRGPNVHAAWCLIGNTPILMADGTQKPLANLRIGERVYTRLGPRSIIAHKKTSCHATVYRLKTMDGRTIIGTANHPIWVEGKGFIPLSSVQPGDPLCVMPVLRGRAPSGTSEKVKTTISEWSCFIGRFGKRLMEKFLLEPIFIIPTEINWITDWKIWNSLCQRRIRNGMAPRILNPIVPLHGRDPWQQGHSRKRRGYVFRKHVCSAGVRFLVVPSIRDGCVLPSVLSKPDQADSLETHVSVNIAEHPIRRKSEGNDFVQNVVIQEHFLNWDQYRALKNSCVASVGNPVWQSGETRSSVAEPVLSHITTGTAIVEKLAQCQPVYNITIDGTHEFFANGILTHNCDELAKFRYPSATWHNLELVLRAGEHPRVCVSTTPRPLAILKELVADAWTRVVRWSTYRNAGNVAPTFIRRILGRYEGTRLGRQELHAEILEDSPDALWTHELLDRTRVTTCPELRAIAIGIDPPGGLVTECGIVASGRSAENHGYVLGDRSVAGKPEKWASTVWALAQWLAETYDTEPRLIAERNHGGEMVRSTLEVSRPAHCSFRIELVTASKGKAARAEPVVMLYEQDRYHHVGTFGALEDEMTQWNPLDASMPSPNRLDALVWSAHGLGLAGGEKKHAGAWGR